MNSLNLSRCALSVCVAAILLAGCGGSQSPVAAPKRVAAGRYEAAGARSRRTAEMNACCTCLAAEPMASVFTHCLRIFAAASTARPC